MKVTAVVVNYYTSGLLGGLCSSLKGQDYLKELVVVNNCPEVIDCRALEEVCGIRVKLLQNSSNRGFSVAVNRALKIADSDFVLIVNPDVRLAPGCLKAMVDASCENDFHLAGPRFYWDDQRIFRLPPATGEGLWLSCAHESAERFNLEAELFSFYWALRHDRFWSMKEPFYEPFLSGACLLISVSLTRKLGASVFDEVFFLYYEDTDLCSRAVSQGIRPMCIPTAEVIHYWDQSPEPEVSKSDLMQKSRSAYLKKHYGPAASGLDFLAEHVSLSDDCQAKRPCTGPADQKLCSSGGQKNPFFLELAMTPLFVPFSQAVIEGEEVDQHSSRWDMIPKGNYFARIRNSMTGVLKVWEWKR